MLKYAFEFMITIFGVLFISGVVIILFVGIIGWLNNEDYKRSVQRIEDCISRENLTPIMCEIIYKDE